MGHARDLHNMSMLQQHSGINLVFPSDSFAVRKALKSLMSGLHHMQVSDETRSVAEIVMAEALNNVVEHAYGESTLGVIEVKMRKQEEQLWVQILDDGNPMPENQLPRAATHDLDTCPEDLPEGGFGWLMIRELTDELQYKRQNQQNRLTFSLPIKTSQQTSNDSPSDCAEGRTDCGHPAR